jgi:hypothetical protein
MTDNNEDRKQRFIERFEDMIFVTEEEARVFTERRKAEIKAYSEKRLREAAEQRKRQAETGEEHEPQVNADNNLDESSN